MTLHTPRGSWRATWVAPLSESLAPVRGLFERGGMGAWRREHEGLRNTVARTRQEVWVIVEQLERCEGVGRASRRGNRRLAALERFLTAHFAREEGRGYLAEALAAAPRYQNRARRLCAQHGELLREIREIRELALQAHLSAEGWTDVYQAYDAFTERLVLHDEAENEIMARAVLDDLGPGD